MAEPADINVDELRRRARRRLVGAVVLALGVAVIVPMLLETEQKPLGEDVSVKIPPVDEGRFVNRLNDRGDKGAPDAAATSPTPAAPPALPAAPGAERASKYDTHVPEGASSPSSPAATPAEPPGNPSASQSALTTAPKAESANAAPERAAAPANTSTAKQAAEPAKTTADSAATHGHDTFAVQLAAFSDNKGANALAGRLKRAGYAAYTEPLKTSKGTLWRVRVGPYPSREAAAAARDKLKTEGQSGIVAAVK
jgi:DedD protein